jgi:hypothetical protein
MDAVLQLPLPETLKSIIDRQVAEGDAPSEADLPSEAAPRCAENEFLPIAQAGIADADAEALFQQTMAEVCATWRQIRHDKNAPRTG